MAQMGLDWDTAGQDGTERETRCYTITGAASVLDGVEAVLRRIEWLGEQSMTRMVSAYVEGANGAKIVARTVATWPAGEGTENDEETGAKLRPVRHKDAICGRYVVDVKARK